MTIPEVTQRLAMRTLIFSIPAFATVFILFSFPCVAFAETNGVNGFAICGTFDSTSSFYVPGDPVYLSDIFQVKVDSPNYELAFKNFLKQKYGWNKNVTCSVSYTSDGATKTFNEKLKQAGTKLVRTGWTLGSAGASAGTAGGAGSSSPPAAAPDPAAGSSYWVCRVSATDGKDYNSDIFRGSDGGYTTFPTVFGQFVQSKYKVTFQSAPTCTDYGVLGQQQAQDALKGYASYSTGVMTGWKYVIGSSSAATAAPATSAPATSGVYWICQLAYYQKTYVSSVFAVSAEESQGGQAMGRLNREFRSFLVAKYQVPPTGGSASCVPQASEARARQGVENILHSTNGQAAIATGWKPGTQDSGAVTSQSPGELGPDGQVIGGSASGAMTPYYCYAQTILPGQHRQTSYTTGPFTSAQPQRWITFWFSQYIHQTYNIPANVANFTIDCYTLGNKTQAQQQATVNANVTSWKQHDNDVVEVNWVPTQAPTPGISVAQLNPMTGQMVTGGIGSNLPPHSNPESSAAQVAQTRPGFVLCATNRGNDGKAYTSAIFKGESEEHLPIEQAFLTFLATKYGPNVPHNTSCVKRAHLADAQSYLYSMKNQAPGAGIKVVETGWTYNGVAPVTGSDGGGEGSSSH